MLIIFLVITLIFYSYRNSYNKFSPILFKGGEFVQIKYEKVNCNNLKIVLDFNNVEYKFSSNKEILIKNYLLNDEELLYNFTKKALDSNWINTHKNYIPKWRKRLACASLAR
jgi:hypothetical protein